MTEAAQSDQLPLRIITYAWGESYVDELLTFAVPALLASGNLPAIAVEVKSELLLLSEERLFPRIAEHPAIKEVQKLCTVRLVGLDDLVTRRDKYGMALTFALHRAFADLGPTVTDHWLIFFNADFILADGSLRNLLGYLRAGERIVASPSYCTVKEKVIPELKRRLLSNSICLALPPREMAQLILQYRHNTIRGKTINQQEFHLLQADQFYWEVDDSTLIGHQMPIAIVGMRPQRYLPEPNSYWDHGLIWELCPTAGVKLLGDSDEFLMLELRSGDVAKEQIVPGLPNPRQLAERMISWVTPYQASFALHPLTLHAADLPGSTELARKELDDFVSRVLSHAPNFPSHVDHPQWNYHWPEFMKSRHDFLSARLGSTTEQREPPSSLSPTDELWWRYDGSKKTLTRRIRVLNEEKIQKLRPSEEALEEVQNELENLLDKKVFSTLLLPPEGEAPFGDSVRQRAITASTKKKQELEDSIASVEGYYRDLIVSLEHQHELLGRKYQVLLQPRVKSAGIPIVYWEGESEPRQGQGRARQIARSFYYRIFGRWPRLTMLNPYWPCTQPLLQTIDAAKASGAKDILLVSERSGISRALAGGTGNVACVSYSGFASGLLHKALEQDQQFDFGVVELPPEDIAQFSELVALAAPHLRAGGMIVGFSVVSNLQCSELELRDLPGRCIVTGSAASARAIAAYGAALANRGGFRPLRLFLSLLRLAVNVPRFWWVNRAEAAAARRGQTSDTAFATSITIVARTPEAEKKND